MRLPSFGRYVPQRIPSDSAHFGFGGELGFLVPAADELSRRGGDRHIIVDPGERALMRQLAVPETVFLQVGDHPIDSLRFHACVDVSRGGEGNVVTVQCDLYAQRPDDDDLVADRLEDRSCIQRRRVGVTTLTSSSQSESPLRRRGRARRRGGSRGRAGRGLRLGHRHDWLRVRARTDPEPGMR